MLAMCEGKFSDAAAIAELTADGRGTRNRRSVWTIPTKPYKGAHFATFPPALVEPCILAGCPVGGNVLDPFAGAGTTGLVARNLDCNATLIELNPSYAALARERVHGSEGNPFTAPAEALVA